MIPAGYMAKRVSTRPEWLHAEQVVDIYSVSHCVSKDFADYIHYWKHNGYWFFDSPEIIQQLAHENSIDLKGTSLFYYEVHELQFDETVSQWTRFKPEPSFSTQVVTPSQKVLAGYDVVTFLEGTSAECSPLSCNALATEVEINPHCLLTSLKQAQHLLKSGQFKNLEPGPYRVFAVYSVTWP
jgi:hypothetical protein